jgi:hypothetical protein
LPKSRILKRKTGGILRSSNKLAVYSIFFNILKRVIKFPDDFVGNAQKYMRALVYVTLLSFA